MPNEDRYGHYWKYGEGSHGSKPPWTGAPPVRVKTSRFAKIDPIPPPNHTHPGL